MPVFGNRFRFPFHETFLLGGWYWPLSMPRGRF
jgi:hypothetical protein